MKLSAITIVLGILTQLIIIAHYGYHWIIPSSMLEGLLRFSTILIVMYGIYIRDYNPEIDITYFNGKRKKRNAKI